MLDFIIIFWFVLLRHFPGIFITLVASCIISRTQVLGKVLAYIGTGTLFIMLFHFVIQNYVYDNLHKAMPFHSFLSYFIPFPVAICVPLLLWEIVKRNRYLSFLLLPLKIELNVANSRGRTRHLIENTNSDNAAINPRFTHSMFTLS